MDPTARIRNYVRQRLLPSRVAWKKVPSGLAAGLWLRVQTSRERNWWRGTHEPHVQAQLREWLTAEAIFFDIGAHFGFFALPAAREAAHVIAFEPDPENVQRLRLHCDRNSLSTNFQIVAAAAWQSDKAQLPFRRGKITSRGGISTSDCRPVLADGETIHVEAISIDSFIARGGPAPSIIKIDVEGGEWQVVLGAVKTIDRCHPKLLIEIHAPDLERRISEFLRHHGYCARWVVPPELYPRQCFAVADNAA